MDAGRGRKRKEKKTNVVFIDTPPTTREWVDNRSPKGRQLGRVGGSNQTKVYFRFNAKPRSRMSLMVVVEVMMMLVIVVVVVVVRLVHVHGVGEL